MGKFILLTVELGENFVNAIVDVSKANQFLLLLGLMRWLLLPNQSALFLTDSVFFSRWGVWKNGFLYVDRGVLIDSSRSKNCHIKWLSCSLIRYRGCHEFTSHRYLH